MLINLMNSFLITWKLLDSSLYNIIDYKTGLNLKILTIMNNNYKKYPHLVLQK